jgi:hypothetical protein
LVVFTDFDRRGLPRTITDAVGARTLMYDHGGRPVADIGTSNLLAGLTVSNHFNSLGQRDLVKTVGTSTVLQHSYGYDRYGRLSSVTSGSQTAEYGYLPNSDRLQTTTFKHSGSPVLSTSRAWEFGERLQSIANTLNAQPSTLNSFTYLYDAVHRVASASVRSAENHRRARG